MTLPYYTPGPMIEPRGNPDGMTLNGQIHELVHAIVPATRDGCHPAKPRCGNGAFNLWWTARDASVNCPVCLARMPAKTARRRAP